jgi:polysaccharide biosynthesis protein PslJ
MVSVLNHIESALFSPERRVALIARSLLLLVGALFAALLVVVAGPLYGPAGAIALAGGLLMLRDIRWGFAALFAVVGFLPFAALPFKIGFTPTFLDVALLAVYFVWIVRIATRRDREFVGTPLGAYVFLFLLVAVFAFANGLRFARPTSANIRNFAELILAISLFFVLVNTLRTRKNVELLARLVILAGAAAAAIAVILYVIPDAWTIRILDALARFNYPGGAGALRYIEDDAANPMRAIGTMVDPNVLGGFLILVGALTAPQLVSTMPLFRRRWIAVFAATEFLALYLTYSRGSLLGLVAAFALIGLLRYRKLLLIGALALALLLLLPAAQGYVERFVEGVLIQDRATQMRIGEYRDALSLISRYPWFGVGFAGSPDADLYVGVSNVYLLIGEIMGVTGLLAFLAVMGVYLGQVWRAWRRRRGQWQEALLLGFGAAIFGGLVGGIFDHYLFNLVYPHMSVLLWTYLGLGMAVVRLSPPEPAGLVRRSATR